MERLAKWNRQKLDLQVVGVTGSVGKTSTKEFLRTVLEGKFQVKAAPKSFNNRLGVALTLLSADASTEVLVVELATSAIGELAHLSRLVRPEKVVLTEIAPAHLEGLGSMEGVVAAKAEVLDGLHPGGRAFLRHGVYGFDHFQSRLRGPVTTFGWEAGDYAVSNCARVFLGGDSSGASRFTAYGYHFTVNGRENFLLPVPGRHNVINATAAIAVARDFGMSWDEIRAALSLSRLPPLRLQVIEERGVVLFDDSYNANPRSMEAAIDEWLSLAGSAKDPSENGSGLDRLAHRDHGGSRASFPAACFPAGPNGREPAREGGVKQSGARLRRCAALGSSPMVAVLGDMLELGADSRRLHEAVGVRLARSETRLLVTVGSESRWILAAYRHSGGRGESAHFSSSGEALPYLQERICAGDRILFKGSRRIGLDRAVVGLRSWLETQGTAIQGMVDSS